MKRGMMKKILLFVALLTLTIALGGCAGDKEEGSASLESDTNSQSEPVYGGSIVVGIPQDLEDSLDPHKAVAAGTKEVLFNLFEGLVKPDSDGNLIPAVASDYEILENGKTYRFTLREGVTFHNGDPVTAQDVKYSIERCADTGPLVSVFSIIDEVEIADEQTVNIILSEENAELLAYLTAAIIPEGYQDQDTNPVGTGPFSFVSRSPQENFIIEKYSEYWGEEAYLDKVEYRIVADSDTVVTNLKGGSLDMYHQLTAGQAEELAGDDFNIEDGTMNLVQALFLNHEFEPFSSLEVRQALCYAVDPGQILDLMADGQGAVIGSNMYPAFKKYYDQSLEDLYPRDVEKAKELLKEAGYENGFEMTITVPSNYQQHVDTAQVIVEQLKEAGISASINLVEWDTWLSEVYADRNYQATVIGLDGGYLTGRYLLERFTSGFDTNFINYSNAEYDRVFAKASTTVDEDEQTSLYRELLTILAEDAANVYIQDIANPVALRKDYGGYEFYPVYVQDMAKIYRIG